MFLTGSIKGSFVIFFVADGLGGHSDASDASQLVVNEIAKSLPDRIEPNEFIQISQNVHDKLVHLGSVRQQKKPMGATFGGIIVDDAKILIANVGDVRIYNAHENLICVTNDMRKKTEIRTGLMPLLVESQKKKNSRL